MWNTAAEHIFGWKKEEVMGKPYPAVPEDKQDKFRTLLMQQLNGNGLTGEVLRRRRKDGSQFYVSVSTGPLRDTNGDIIGLLSIMTDITERKHAEDALSESEERLKIVGGLAYDLIYEWIVADDKLIWFGNIDEKLGYDRNEISNTIEGWLKLIVKSEAETRRHREAPTPATLA